MTVIVLHGPKAAGKSQVAAALQARGVAHVDADELVLDLCVVAAEGSRHQSLAGWLWRPVGSRSTPGEPLPESERG
jgi:hypothetical protein